VEDRANSLFPPNSSSTEPILLHEHFLERSWPLDGSYGGLDPQMGLWPAPD
jgi:hypothetical protein